MSREHLEEIWRAGMEACLPARVLPQLLPVAPPGRTIVLALGKAAVPMARSVEARWRGPLTGLAVAPHGSGGALQRVEMTTAAHPVPDRAASPPPGGCSRSPKRGRGRPRPRPAERRRLALACLPGEGWTG